jgi:hypothetical protein
VRRGITIVNDSPGGREKGPAGPPRMRAMGGLIAALSILAVACARPAADPLEPALRVTLPEKGLPFPQPLPEGRGGPKFVLRGTKGWAWTWEQYLAEIPILAAYKMNFLMSCYTSVFTDPVKFVNNWWEPLPEKALAGIAKVARACREAGIVFCFSFHPALSSDRPLRYDSDADFETMWRNYASVQALGVRWFSLSYDDIDVKGKDIAALGKDHAALANRLFRRLREADKEAELIFCPVYYWGAADSGESQLYTEALGRVLDRDILVFWTGDAVVTPRITRAAAESFRRTVAHRIVIWDNYPVNDRSGALHLGPVTGRDPDLDEVAFGYMSNPHSPQNEINRIPLLTCADYAYNPGAYDPGRSIGQAIVHLADTPAERAVLKDLVELYPGDLICGSTMTGYNSVLERIAALMKKPDGPELAGRLLRRVENAAKRLASEFPGRYAETKRTLADHIARARAILDAGDPVTGRKGRYP